jgi:hypothetical protein
VRPRESSPAPVSGSQQKATEAGVAGSVLGVRLAARPFRPRTVAQFRRRATSTQILEGVEEVVLVVVAPGVEDQSARGHAH